MLRTRIPFFTTQMGKGTVPGGSKLYMGTAALSERDYVHEAIEQADLIITIGHDTIEKPPFIMGPKGPKVIHVGYPPANVEQVYFPHAEVVGDLGPSLELLADRVEGKITHAQALLPLREGILARIADRADEERFPPTPQRIVHDVRQVMPSDGIVALDNGMYKIWFARNYRTHVANTLLLDNALATMGAGLPSAMMAALLYPNRRVLAVCGDGGFMMNTQEMETAVRLKLNLVVLILEDYAYGMIRWKQAVDSFADFGMTFGNPDFVRYAEGYGAKGTRVTATDDLVPALEAAFRRRRRASRRRADRLFGEQARAGRRARKPRPRGRACLEPELMLRGIGEAVSGRQNLEEEATMAEFEVPGRARRDAEIWRRQTSQGKGGGGRVHEGSGQSLREGGRLDTSGSVRRTRHKSKASDYAEANVNAAFDFAQKLVRAKDRKRSSRSSKLRQGSGRAAEQSSTRTWRRRR